MSFACPNTQNELCPDDWGINILRDIFGEAYVNAFLQDGVNPATVADPQTVMSIATSSIATLAITAAILIIVISTYKWITESANDGEAVGLSERTGLIGFFGRPAFSLIMLAPTASGYPVIHMIIMVLVLWSNGAANSLYYNFVETRLTPIGSNEAILENSAFIQANSVNRAVVYGALHGYCAKVADASYGAQTIMRYKSTPKSASGVTVVSGNQVVPKTSAYQEVVYSMQAQSQALPRSINLCGTFTVNDYQPKYFLSEIAYSNTLDNRKRGIIDAINRVQQSNAQVAVRINDLRRDSALRAYYEGFTYAYGSGANSTVLSNVISARDKYNPLRTSLGVSRSYGNNWNGWSVDQGGDTADASAGEVASADGLVTIGNQMSIALNESVKEVLRSVNSQQDLANSALALREKLISTGWIGAGNAQAILRRHTQGSANGLLTKPYSAVADIGLDAEEAQSNPQIVQFIRTVSGVNNAILGEIGSHDALAQDVADINYEASIAKVLDPNGVEMSKSFDDIGKSMVSPLLSLNETIAESMTGAGAGDNVDAITRIHNTGEYIILASGAVSLATSKVELGMYSFEVLARLGKSIPFIGRASGAAADAMDTTHRATSDLILDPLDELLDGLTKVGRVFSVVIPSMPYVFLVLAAVGWFVQIIQTKFGMVLWLIMHSIPEKSFVGSQQQGYVTLLALFFRPPLVISAFFLAFVIYDPMVTLFTEAFFQIQSNISGGTSSNVLSETIIYLFSLRYWWYLYAAGLMMITYYIFGLVQELADSVLNWVGINMLTGFGNLSTVGTMQGAGSAMAEADQKRKKKKEERNADKEEKLLNNPNKPPNADPNAVPDGSRDSVVESHNDSDETTSLSSGVHTPTDDGSAEGGGFREDNNALAVDVGEKLDADDSPADSVSTGNDDANRLTADTDIEDPSLSLGNVDGANTDTDADSTSAFGKGDADKLSSTTDGFSEKDSSASSFLAGTAAGTMLGNKLVGKGGIGGIKGKGAKQSGGKGSILANKLAGGAAGGGSDFKKHPEAKIKETVDSNGNVTRTATNPSGEKLTQVSNKDGSSSRTVEKPDGSSSSINVSANGTVSQTDFDSASGITRQLDTGENGSFTESYTADDGSVLSTTNHQENADGGYESTTSTPSSIAVTNGNSETGSYQQSVYDVNADGSKGEKISAVKHTANADGSAKTVASSVLPNGLGTVLTDTTTQPNGDYKQDKTLTDNAVNATLIAKASRETDSDGVVTTKANNTLTGVSSENKHFSDGSSQSTVNSPNGVTSQSTAANGDISGTIKNSAGAVVGTIVGGVNNEGVQTTFTRNAANNTLSTTVAQPNGVAQTNVVDAGNRVLSSTTVVPDAQGGAQVFTQDHVNGKTSSIQATSGGDYHATTQSAGGIKTTTQGNATTGAFSSMTSNAANPAEQVQQSFKPSATGQGGTYSSSGANSSFVVSGSNVQGQNFNPALGAGAAAIGLGATQAVTNNSSNLGTSIATSQATTNPNTTQMQSPNPSTASNTIASLNSGVSGAGGNIAPAALGAAVAGGALGANGYARMTTTTANGTTTQRFTPNAVYSQTKSNTGGIVTSVTPMTRGGGISPSTTVRSSTLSASGQRTVQNLQVPTPMAIGLADRFSATQSFIGGNGGYVAPKPLAMAVSSQVEADGRRSVNKSDNISSGTRVSQQQANITSLFSRNQAQGGNAVQLRATGTGGGMYFDTAPAPTSLPRYYGGSNIGASKGVASSHTPAAPASSISPSPLRVTVNNTSSTAGGNSTPTSPVSPMTTVDMSSVQDTIKSINIPTSNLSQDANADGSDNQ